MPGALERSLLGLVCDRIHYTLDAAGNRPREETLDPTDTWQREPSRTYTTLGQQQSIIGGNTRYCYDARGQLVRKVQIASGGPTRSVLASYTAAGRLDTLTYPSGATVRYLRDSQGRTIGVMGKPTAAAAEVALVNQARRLGGRNTAKDHQMSEKKNPKLDCRGR